MLIWIRVPSAAIGVFAIIVLLLATAVSEETLATTIIEEAMTNVTTSKAGETENVRVTQLPFVNSLLNPCSSSFPITRQSHGHRSVFRPNFFDRLAFHASDYKKDAQDMIDNNPIVNCSILEIQNLPNTPSLQELQLMEEEEALRHLYSSVLMHSAYAYFIHHQFNSSAIPCSENIRDERQLAAQSLNLAKKLKYLACIMRLGINYLGYNNQDYENSFLNETLTDLTLCSRRALRDCQVMQSTVYLLNVASDYCTSAMELTPSPQAEKTIFRK